MIQDKIEYWTKFAFDKMRKQGATMPTIIVEVLKMEDFINSSVLESESRESIKERFSKERQYIINNAKVQ